MLLPKCIKTCQNFLFRFVLPFFKMVYVWLFIPLIVVVVVVVLFVVLQYIPKDLSVCRSPIFLCAGSHAHEMAPLKNFVLFLFDDY